MIMQSLFEEFVQGERVKSQFWFGVNFCCRGLGHLEQYSTVTNEAWIAFYIR